MGLMELKPVRVREAARELRVDSAEIYQLIFSRRLRAVRGPNDEFLVTVDHVREALAKAAATG